MSAVLSYILSLFPVPVLHAVRLRRMWLLYYSNSNNYKFEPRCEYNSWDFIWQWWWYTKGYIILKKLIKYSNNNKRILLCHCPSERIFVFWHIYCLRYTKYRQLYVLSDKLLNNLAIPECYIRVGLCYWQCMSYPPTKLCSKQQN